MQHLNPRRNVIELIGACAVVVSLAASRDAKADEGGVSFWLPGQFGSLAAAPLNPGWTVANIYYHTSVTAGGNAAAAREFTIGRFNPNVNINLNLKLKADADLAVVAPTYVFTSPVLGGQLAIGMAGIYGRNSTSLNGTLTTSLGDLVTTRSGSMSDGRAAFADLYPQASLRWNNGVHNLMTYAMGDVPVGAYDPTRLANFGIGHGAIDRGLGYTYLDPQTGREFSVVSGLTYNFKNTKTDYQNGINWHVDWGLSQFLTKQFLVGAVGYFYDQLTADRGAPLFWATTRRGSPASDRRSATLFRWVICRAI